jgi:hypothetical protein
MGMEGVDVRVGIDDRALSGVRLAEDRRGEEHREGQSESDCVIQCRLWVFAMVL